MGRRTFIRLALLAGIAASAAYIERATRPVGPVRFLRWTARGYQRRVAGRATVVGLAQCSSYDDGLVDCLQHLWQQCKIPDVEGKRVLVKPNLVDSIEGHPATTHPAVVGALLDLLAMHGASEVVVGDGPAFRREAWPVVEACGLAEVLARRRVPFVDLNYDDPQPVPARGGWFLHQREIWLPRHVREADLIVSVPKAKTHHWAGVSLSLKNLFGIVPGSRYGWPRNMLHVNGIPLSILGLYEVVRPVVAVVDGIVGMEGDGPLFGTAVPHGLLAVGADPVAVDTICTRAMGLAPEGVAHLALGRYAGIGEADRVEIRGASLESLQREYEAAPSL